MPAAEGDSVKIDCTVTVASGAETATPDEPFNLEFTIGESSVLPGLEKAVVGMEPGSIKTARIPPDDAFGPHKPDLVFPVSKEQISIEQELEVGQMLEIRQADGSAQPARVAEIRPEFVVLDTNHPLAGEELVVEIKLLAVA